MSVNKKWIAIPPFEASPGEIIKLFECPHCHIWVKGAPVICPNCDTYCGRPGSATGKPSSHNTKEKENNYASK